MPLLYLEPLLPHTKKGDLLHLLCAVGGIGRGKVGRIDLYGAVAVVEVPSGWEMRLAKSLDGAELKRRRALFPPGRSGCPTGTEAHFCRLARLVRLESEGEANEIVKST